MTYSNLIVTGSIAKDEIMDFPYRFEDSFDKEKLHQINISFVVERLTQQLGGTGTNISYNATLLTKKTVSLLSAVGKDGNEFLEFLKKKGVKTDGIIEDKDLYTSTGKVITDIKGNQIWGFYHGASGQAKNIKIPEEAENGGIVVISANHSDPFLHFQSEAIRRKLPYLYDPGMVLSWIKDSDLREGIEHATWLIGNDYEIAQILKRLEMKEEYLKEKKVILIRTLGEHGVEYTDAEKTINMPGYKVENALDPTGAGDAWRGGFLAGMLEGKEMKECLAWGSALASFAVETYGTVNPAPSVEDVTNRANTLKVINKISKP